MREIKLLCELDHGNVMPLYEVFSEGSSMYLVLKYMHTDLEAVIKDKERVLTPPLVRKYLRMTLQAVEYCHANYVLHRDLKPANLLLDQHDNLVLSDFGLAKVYGSPDRLLSPQACTRWYRAPELLFGSVQYGASADMWSVGCIFAELLLRVPLFAGESDLDQLSRIFACLGTPDLDEDWTGADALPQYVAFESRAGVSLESIFRGVSSSALDLLSRMLCLTPSSRISASEALRHVYLQEEDL
jgi:cyclin-dependent kinase 7